MANRFNKIIDQEYVGMPFQEILAAASIRQKTGDTNKALYDDANTMLSKYAAIPQSADEEYKKTSEKTIEGIISNYISDPNKLYNPNTMYNFKREINQAVDFNRLKLGNDSYSMYSKDIENQKALQAAGKFKQELVPGEWQGWDSRKGIYDKFTPGYEESFKTTNPYIQNYTPHKDIDPATGQMREFVDMKDLANQADLYAPNYMQTTSFQHELALAKKQGHPLAADPESYAKEVLIRDWSYKLKDLELRGWTPPRGKGKGAGEKAQSSIPDWGFDRMTNPNSPLTTADLATITGTDPMTYKVGPNEIQANQIKFDPESTINAYGTILRPQNAIQASAFDGILKLENLYKQVAGKVGTVVMEDYLNPQWGEGLSNFEFTNRYKSGETQPSEDDIKSRNKIFEETLATKKQLEYSLKQITGKDYSKDNLVNPAVRKEAFRDVLKASGLDKKFTSIEDAMTSLTVLGSALDAVNNGSTGPFVPSSGKGNKTYTVDENGEYVMNVNGTRYITKQEMDIAFNDSSGLFDDAIWEKKFVKEEGGNGLIKRMSGDGDEAVYAIPTSIRVPMTNDAMDRINKGEYSAEQREKYSDYNHARRQEIAQDRMITARAGSEFLSSLGEADKAMNEFINTADEDILRGAGYTKKSLRDEYQKAIGSGDTFKIGEFARKQHDLTLNNKYMQALGASEVPSGQHVQNYDGSSAIGSHQVMYSAHKDLFKRYGLDGGTTEKSLELIKKNPSKYKAMVSDLVSQTRKEAEYIASNNPDSPYGQDEMVALTYFLGAGNLQNYLDLLAQTNGNEAQAWSMMDKKITKNNVMPSQYLSKFNAKLNT
jgi:hypothetical protein